MYKDPQRQKEAQHNWYVSHLTLTYQRTKNWKRKHKQSRGYTSEQLKWYHNIRRQVLKGFSTTSMPKEAQELWWFICNHRVRELEKRLYKYPDCFDLLPL